MQSSKAVNSADAVVVEELKVHAVKKISVRII